MSYNEIPRNYWWVCPDCGHTCTGFTDTGCKTIVEGHLVNVHPNTTLTPEDNIIWSNIDDAELMHGLLIKMD